MVRPADGMNVAAPEPIWTEEVQWSIRPEPVFIVGTEAGKSEYVLGRVSAATLLGNGNLVLADRMANQLRIFDSRGKYIRTLGGPGEGPGEYKSLATMTRTSHDTLIVGDPVLKRITVLDSLGRVARTFRPEPFHSSENISALAAIDDEQILVLPFRGSVPVGDGLTADTISVGIMQFDSGRTSWVGRFREQESIVRRSDGRVRSRRAPFARSTFAAAGVGRYYVGTSDRDRITAYDAEGHVVTVIGGVRLTPPVPRDGVRRYYEATLPTGTSVDAYLRRIPYPEAAPATMPAFDYLIVDPDTNLWVRRYAPPWAASRSEWDVHDPRGAWLGTVQLPFNRPSDPGQPDLLEVGREYVLVLSRDSLDVERVAKYEVLKPSSHDKSQERDGD